MINWPISTGQSGLPQSTSPQLLESLTSLLHTVVATLIISNKHMPKQLPTNRKLQVPTTGTMLLRMKFTDQTNNWPISTGRNGLPQQTYKAVAHLKWQQNNLQQTTIHHTPSLNTERRTPPYHTLMLPTSLPTTANLHQNHL